VSDPFTTLLARYGFVPLRRRCVARLDGELHRVVTTAGDDLGVRLYEPARLSRAALLAEVSWLEALDDEGVSVPRPLRDLEGRALHAWPGQGRALAVVRRWLVGRTRVRSLTPAAMHSAGVLAARLHACGGSIAARLRARGLAFDAELAPWAAGTRPGSGRLPASLRRVASASAAALIPKLASLPRRGAHFGPVHGDLHIWNLVFRPGGTAGAIDFADFGFGHHALDLATLLQYLRHPLPGREPRRQDPGAMEAALWQGYASVRPPPPPAQVDVYVEARMFTVLDWMLDDWPALDHLDWGPAYLSTIERVLARAAG
jgi:Ser/Thr protein kinase RdoA (MazF antagonist)